MKAFSKLILVCSIVFIGLQEAEASGANVINVSFASNTNNILAGEQVVFYWTGDYQDNFGNCGTVTYTYDFGGGMVINGSAVQMISMAPYAPNNVTVQYDMPGNFTTSLTAISDVQECLITNSPFSGPIIAVSAAAPIPTLGQWGLFVLALSVMIVGAIWMKREYMEKELAS